ncbi:two-component regulator propeller domain-containing protein [Pseudomonas sp. NPDC089554]|uniref:sensor histidine kinase n=1 Tax=Pseudomonas sp. NPDC089554 TaxID=3390653 RepID=UPI003CFE419F
MLCCLLAAWLFWLCNTAVAAPSGLDKVEHHRWTVAGDGPSQVGALAQTRDGYLWMGTNDSLYRFDGLRFTRYTPPDGSTLGIISVLQAEDEGLWVGRRMGGISLVSDRGLTHYPVGGGLPAGVVYSIAKDRSGAVWAAVTDGLARFDGKAWQRIGAERGFPGQHARAMLVARDGTVWAANEERLFYLPIGSDSFVDAGVAVGWVNQMTEGPDGAIWLTERYDGDLRRIQLRDGKGLVQASPNDGANALLFDSRGGLWLGTAGEGVRYLAPAKSHEVHGLPGALAGQARFGVKDGLSSNYVIRFLEDADGNVWVGSSSGLDRFQPRVVVPAGLPPGVRNLALAADKDGALWIGSSNRQVLRQDLSSLASVEVPAPISSVFTDALGSVWMAGNNGIWRARGEQVERVASLPTPGLPDSAVRAMTRDPAGNLWLSLNRRGLFVLRDGQWSKQAPPSDDPTQVMPVTASTDRNGRLWFGYRNNLIVTRDEQGERHWGEGDGLQVGHVTAMQHAQDVTWVGGQRGLAFFRDNRFQHLQLPDNGLFENVYAIVTAPSQQQAGGYDLWLQSKAGIFQLTAQELQRAFGDPNYPVRYHSFETVGGLANDPHQVLALPTGVRCAEGRLWFSTSNGLVWIDPKGHLYSKPVPQVRIESFNVDGSELTPKQRTGLPAQTRRIEISYSAPSLSGQQSLHFRYQLEGVDAQWQEVGAERSAIYTELGPGSYRFRVVAVNQDGVQSDAETVLAFSIRPVFYRTPWFLVLCALASASLLWGLHRLRMQRAAAQLLARLEGRHMERERIARELHDTLLQGVQGLLLSFQASAGQMPPSHPERLRMERALDRAEQVLVEARDMVNDLRDLSEPAVNLGDALAAVTSELHLPGAARFSVTREGLLRELHPIVCEESYRIGREAIMNAFRHANARHIELRLDYGRQQFRLSVVDDGDGIDPLYLPPNIRPRHWGLHGMQERAGKIGAKLCIQRSTDRGTEVHLSIPALMAYRRFPRRLGLWLRALNKWRR